jgi:tripartite-type tricarboxylate transporter receptor subunit TctC
MKKRHLLRGLCAATLAVASLGLAQAQTYPSKSVRLIVPFPAGGATDLFARTLSQKISERLHAHWPAGQRAQHHAGAQQLARQNR